MSCFAGDRATASTARFAEVRTIAYSAVERALFVGTKRALSRIDTQTATVTSIPMSIINFTPYGIAVCRDGTLVVACCGTHTVYAIIPSTRHFVRLAGGRHEEGGPFRCPFGVAIDEDGDSGGGGGITIFVSDLSSNQIVALSIPG